MRFGWMRRAATLATLLLAGAAWAQATIYGKNLLRTEDLPPSVLQKFAEHNARNKSQTGLFADSVDWVGAGVAAQGSGGPYRIVVKVEGVALAPGDVTARLDTGWGLGDGMTRLSPSAHVRRDGARGGDRVELVTASAPLRFKEDRQVLPTVSFVGSSNLKLENVRVEVWSGLGKSSFASLVTAWAPLLTGVVFLGLFLWWRKR